MARELITIAEGRRRVLGALPPALAPETLTLREAEGRVLAEEVRATGDVPPFPNSAMDGFAVRAEDEPGTPDGLEIVDESRAGTPARDGVAPGTAVRISTGAPMPDGATAVVPVERTREADGRVHVDGPVRPGAHVRGAGEDLRADQAVLATGATLGPAELAMAAAAGRAELACAARPTVAVITTGAELVAPGGALGPGAIHDTNSVALPALVRRAGGVATVQRGVADDRGATIAALEAALADADMVVVSGGVSVGPHDHVRPALDSLGAELGFWGVGLKPGKPTWFGTCRERLVFGLPGNPVSAMVTFWLFARTALRGLAGMTPLPEREVVELGEDLRRERRELVIRMRVHHRDGRRVVTTTGPQGSHMLSSMVGAGALAFIAPGEGVVATGSPVEAELLD